MNKFLVLFALFCATAHAVETGPAYSILRAPSAGGRMQAGSIDLSQSAAVGSSLLGVTNGGLGVAISAGTNYQPLRYSSGGTLGYGSLDISQSAVVGSTILPLANMTRITPVMTTFLSSTSTYYLPYAFTITSGSATVGATYTNNSFTFTVYQTVASATQVIMYGTGAPTSSGTLTKSGGTGDSTITFSYSMAPNVLRVIGVGGGGGGGGGGSSNNAGSGTGGNTTFGSSLLTANGGGAGGARAGSPGSGGSYTINSPAIGLGTTGGYGGGAGAYSANVGSGGGDGGNTVFGGGGGGAGSQSSLAGFAGATNTGGGGGGGCYDSNAVAGGGGMGGGGGGSFDALLYNPSASYATSVGAGGTAGNAGTGGNAGGAGGSGKIIVFASYH